MSQWTIQSGNVFWTHGKKFQKCNATKKYSPKRCLNYVLNFSEPGDTIVLKNKLYTYTEQANG